MANLRRLADDIEPYLYIDLTVEEPVDPADTNDEVTPYTCPICFEGFEEPVTTMCGHIFCKACLNRSLARAAVCPLCLGAVWNTLRIYI